MNTSKSYQHSKISLGCLIYVLLLLLMLLLLLTTTVVGVVAVVAVAVAVTMMESVLVMVGALVTEVDDRQNKH